MQQLVLESVRTDEECFSKHLCAEICIILITVTTSAEFSQIEGERAHEKERLPMNNQLLGYSLDRNSSVQVLDQ